MFRQLSNGVASLLVFGGLGMVGMAHSVAGATIVPLNGWTPDVVDTNNATWSSGNYIQVTSGTAEAGSATYVATGSYAGYSAGSYKFNGYLPFSPAAGHIYTLSATLNPTADWVGFGFATGSTISATPWQSVNNPNPWMLANANGGGIQWNGGTVQDTTTSSPAGATTYSIVLNTSSGTEYNGGWTTQLLQGSTALYNPAPFYESNSNLAISSIGLAQDANNSGGTWQNFTLTDQNVATATATTIYQDSFGAPQVLASGTIVPDTQFNYMYAPSAMYDQTDGLYKVWTTYNTSSMSGGQSFTPLYTNNATNGYALIAPGTNFVANSYGVGQPAVVQANNKLWYMIYTDAPNSAQTPTFQVISSSSPTFNNYTDVTTLSQNTVGSASLDLAYDPSTSEFITIANATNITQIGSNSIQLTFFDNNWNVVRSLPLTINNQTFSFGEGVGLLTNAEKQLLDPYLMSFFGATVNAADLANNVPAYWVKGNFNYLNVRSSLLTVPDPSALGLFAVGGMALMLVGRNHKRHKKSGSR